MGSTISQSDPPADEAWEDLDFRAYLSVTSFELLSAEITNRVGVTPHYSHNIGDANPYREGGVYKWTGWEWRLDLSDEISRSTEGLSEAVEALDGEMADRLAALVQASCEVSLVVVQEFVIGEDLDTGIHLTAAAMRWIARAGALLDVDQYVWEMGRRALQADSSER